MFPNWVNGCEIVDANVGVVDFVTIVNVGASDVNGDLAMTSVAFCENEIALWGESMREIFAFIGYLNWEYVLEMQNAMNRFCLVVVSSFKTCDNLYPTVLNEVIQIFDQTECSVL